MFMIPLGIQAQWKSWTADNGNGTFTNPLFYDEFSDPDILRVGDDYYLVVSIALISLTMPSH